MFLLTGYSASKHCPSYIAIQWPVSGCPTIVWGEQKGQGFGELLDRYPGHTRKDTTTYRNQVHMVSVTLWSHSMLAGIHKLNNSQRQFLKEVVLNACMTSGQLSKLQVFVRSLVINTWSGISLVTFDVHMDTSIFTRSWQASHCNIFYS